MGNGVKMLFSIAIGAVVGVVTYFSSKSSTSESQISNNTSNSTSGGPANRNNSNGPNQSDYPSNRCNGGFNNFRKSVSEINNDGFVDFLVNSQICLEKFLSIMKSLALSLEYMSRIFSNQQTRKALPQYIY